MWVLISKYISIYFFSFAKYMFAPYAGGAAGFTFLENHIVTFVGALSSAAIFYFGASYFNEKARLRNIKKDAIRIEQGKEAKKKFTRRNKIILKIKRGIGLYGLGIFAPIFLSIPIGSIIIAKFYGKKKIAFWYIVLVLYLYSLISCIIVEVL